MIQVKNKADVYEIYLTGDIDDDRWKGTEWSDDAASYPSEIRDLLKEAKGKEVHLYVNSGGGDVFAGVAIGAMIRRHDARVIGHVDGLAASAATFPLFSCDEIRIPENAYIMIHKPSAGGWGNANDLRKTADTLDKIQEGMLQTYKAHTLEGVDDAALTKLIDEETWLTGVSTTNYFNVTVEQPLRAVACTGDRLKKYESVPETLQVVDEVVQEESSDELTQQQKLQLIELALI